MGEYILQNFVWMDDMKMEVKAMIRKKVGMRGRKKERKRFIFE